MDNVKERVMPYLRRIRNVGLNETVQTVFWAIVLFLVYSSVNDVSLGLEYLIVTVILAALALRKKNDVCWTIPTIALAFCVLGLLFISGKMGERGFNAPIVHALKFIFLAFVHIAAVLIGRLSSKRRGIVVGAALVSVIISCIVSVVCVLFGEAAAMRYPEQLGFPQVVDFNQLYAISFILVVVVSFLLLEAKTIKPVVLYLPVLISTGVCIALSMITTAILLTMLGLVIGGMYAIFRRNRKGFRIVVIVICVVILICLIFHQQVSDMLYDLAGNLPWLVAARVRAVVDIVFGTTHENWYAPDRRNELASYSVDSFLNNPVFGVGYKGYGYGVVGCHQEWVDMLATFGIVGGLVFLTVMVIITVQTFRNAKTATDKGCFLIGLAMLAVLGCMNPCLSVPVLTAVFVVSPNVSSLPLLWSQTKEDLAAVKEKLVILKKRGKR